MNVRNFKIQDLRSFDPWSPKKFTDHGRNIEVKVSNTHYLLINLFTSIRYQIDSLYKFVISCHITTFLLIPTPAAHCHYIADSSTRQHSLYLSSSFVTTVWATKALVTTSTSMVMMMYQKTTTIVNAMAILSMVQHDASYQHEDSINRTGTTFKVCSRFSSEALGNRSLLLMVRWIWHSEFRVRIDCVNNVPDTMNNVRISNTVGRHDVIGRTASKISECTSKRNRWSDKAIGNIPMVLSVCKETRTCTPQMISWSPSSILDECTFDNAVLKLSRKLSEGMILHPVCFPEDGWTKLPVDILYLVSGTWVCCN